MNETDLREGECFTCGEKLVRSWNRTSAAYPHDCDEPEHRKSRDCWCLPRIEVHNGADLVIHNSKEDGN